MTQVAFHFGAPDRLQYTCRLLRKVVGTGMGAVVLGEKQVLDALDASLWSVGSTDFVTHAVQDAPPSHLRRSRVLLATALTDAAAAREVLVNLHPQWPSDVNAFARVIEVVSAQGDDRESARAKWRQYTAAGYTIVRHDLKTKEAGE
ncbi:MAG: DNA polymerase III subunit chi [Rhodoferax sp.]|nr:MAG: DNA polymerase III subunit chi [Rhodoferax sp.]